MQAWVSVSFGVLVLGRWEQRLGVQGMSRLEVLGPRISVQRLWVFMVWVPMMWVLHTAGDAGTSDVAVDGAGGA